MRTALGPDLGELLVRTSRTGLGSRAGHDLTLAATDWDGELSVDGPTARVRVRVPVAGLSVREGHGGLRPLTDRDRAEIHRTIQRKILDAARHPDITFTAELAADHAAGPVTGELTVAGETRPLELDVTRHGDRVRATGEVVQSRWGITPYTALFGTLRLADAVTVEASIELPAGGGDRAG